jgi:hypothetical protein
MRRIDIINAAAKIEAALLQSDMQGIILTVLAPSTQGKYNSEAIVAGFYAYTRSYETFGAAEKKMLNILNISGLESPKTLSSLLSEDKASRDSNMMRQYNRGIIYALEYLPKFIAMLKQDNIDYEKDVTGSKIIETNDSRGLLTLILPENEREISTPERLVKAIESVRLFYGVFATINGLSDNDLSVAAIDSGSDKSFDFLGAAKLMESTKELILGLWDRVVFHREKKAREKLDLISASLPILAELSNLEKDNKLGREQCEILRRNVLLGTDYFLSAGAIIPGFSSSNYHNPRELMAPEAKLLTESTEYTRQEPIVNEVVDDAVDSKDSNGLSDEENEVLKRLNAKRKK